MTHAWLSRVLLVLKEGSDALEAAQRAKHILQGSRPIGNSRFTKETTIALDEVLRGEARYLVGKEARDAMKEAKRGREGESERMAMMTGGSAVQKDVPPFCMTRSVSPNTVMGLNVIGLRRAGLTPAERGKLKWAFDVLYRSGLPVPRALVRLEEDDHPLVREFREFVASSRRGVCKFFGEDADPEAARRAA